MIGFASTQERAMCEVTFLILTYLGTFAVGFLFGITVSGGWLRKHTGEDKGDD